MIQEALQPWIRELAQLDPAMSQIPLFGNAPAFDWEKLSHTLAERLELPGLTLRLSARGWKERPLIEESLGVDPFIAKLKLAPLDASLFLTLSRADLGRLLSWMHPDLSKGFSTEALKEGLARFILLEAIDAASQISPLDTLTAVLEEHAHLSESLFYCLDIQVEKEGALFWVRLFFSKEFQKRWISYFADTPPAYQPTALTKNLHLTVELQIGSLSLSLQEWEALQLGDLLLLDRTSYNPEQEHGFGTLSVGGVLLFQAQVLRNKLQIVEMTEE